jgi:hypothetical protein
LQQFIDGYAVFSHCILQRQFKTVLGSWGSFRRVV